jgi:hypothetical protein
MTTTLDLVDREFYELMCADPDLVAAEFDEIVAGAWGTASPRNPRPARRPPRPSGPSARRPRRDEHRTPAQRAAAVERVARQRGPPRPRAALPPAPAFVT